VAKYIGRERAAAPKPLVGTDAVACSRRSRFVGRRQFERQRLIWFTAPATPDIFRVPSSGDSAGRSRQPATGGLRHSQSVFCWRRWPAAESAELCRKLCTRTLANWRAGRIKSGHRPSGCAAGKASERFQSGHYTPGVRPPARGEHVGFCAGS